MAEQDRIKNNLEFSNGTYINLKEKRQSRETAQYIADMVLELRNMAKSVELKTLQGLLEVSFYEAFSAANKVEVPPDEIEHLRELSRASLG